jgi:hypothetical protein
MEPEKTEFRIEGLNIDGQWTMLDKPMPPDVDHQAHRDEVIATLRRFGIRRYSVVRVMKYVTTAEQAGEKVHV